MPWHWLLHVLGVTPLQPSYWYNWWSGAGSDIGELAIAGALVSVYRKHNCGVRWCWRVGRHDFADPSTGLTHVLCRRHHPAHPGRPVTAAHIRKQYHLYLGRQPGRG